MTLLQVAAWFALFATALSATEHAFTSPAHFIGPHSVSTTGEEDSQCADAAAYEQMDTLQTVNMDWDQQSVSSPAWLAATEVQEAGQGARDTPAGPVAAQPDAMPKYLLPLPHGIESVMDCHHQRLQWPCDDCM